MATLKCNVTIQTLRVPPGRRPLDREDLCRRVSAELTRLLEREPLRALPPEDGRIQVDGARVHAASAATAASLAHAVARRIHTDLQHGGGWR